MDERTKEQARLLREIAAQVRAGVAEGQRVELIHRLVMEWDAVIGETRTGSGVMRVKIAGVICTCTAGAANALLQWAGKADRAAAELELLGGGEFAAGDAA